MHDVVVLLVALSIAIAMLLAALVMFCARLLEMWLEERRRRRARRYWR